MASAAVQMKNDVLALSGSSPRAMLTTPASCLSALNSPLTLPDRLALDLRERRRARREVAGLHRELRHDTMEGRAVVHPELREAQEVAHVARRHIRREADDDVAQRWCVIVARYCASSSTAVSANGAADAGGVSRTVALVIATRVVSRPSASSGVCEICSATSRPSTTSPKTVNCPSSPGWSVRQMKNCAPALSGLLGMRTAATAPRTCLRSFGSRFSRFKPPVP